MQVPETTDNETRPLATRDEWLLRNRLYSDPNCRTVDEHGELMADWQQELCRELIHLEESRRWSATPMEKDGRHGLWNQFEEKVCVPPVYDAVGEVPELEPGEVAFNKPVPVCQKGLWGLVSPDGSNNILLPFEYQEVKYMEDNIIKVKQYGKYGLLFLPLADKNPEPGFPCIADDIYYDDCIDRLVYRIQQRLGLVGVTEALFEGFRLFDDANESIVASVEGRSGFITLTGDFYFMDSTLLPVDSKRLHHYELSTKELNHLKPYVYPS